jgi:hypothetical protein
MGSADARTAGFRCWRWRCAFSAPRRPPDSTVRKKVLALFYSMRQAPLLVDIDAALRRELSDGLGDRLGVPPRSTSI